MIFLKLFSSNIIFIFVMFFLRENKFISLNVISSCLAFIFFFSLFNQRKTVLNFKINNKKTFSYKMLFFTCNKDIKLKVKLIFSLFYQILNLQSSHLSSNRLILYFEPAGWQLYKNLFLRNRKVEKKTILCSCHKT